jgi:hypothetical protein
VRLVKSKSRKSEVKFSSEEKGFRTGSIEKYRAPEEYDVESANDEGQFADLSPATSGPDVVSQPAADH